MGDEEDVPSLTAGLHTSLCHGFPFWTVLNHVTNFYFLTQTPGDRPAAMLSFCSSREGKQKQVLQTSPSQPSSLFWKTRHNVVNTSHANWLKWLCPFHFYHGYEDNTFLWHHKNVNVVIRCQAVIALCPQRWDQWAHMQWMFSMFSTDLEKYTVNKRNKLSP